MELRDHVLKSVASGADNRFHGSYLVTPLARQLGRQPTEVYQALWGLLADGLIYLDPNGQGSSTDNWVWRATPLGLSIASGGAWEPRDQTGFLARLRRSKPAVSPEALVYVTEALSSFNARAYLATSVMMGVAAEQAFNELAASLVAAHPTTTVKLKRVLEDPRSSQRARYDEFRKAVEPLKNNLPDGLADPLTMDAVADLLRVSRNDAGHPAGKTIDEAVAAVHLQMGALYLIKMSELRAHFTGSATTP